MLEESPFFGVDDDFVEVDVHESFNDDANLLSQRVGSVKGLKIGHLNVNGLLCKFESCITWW